MRTTMIGRWLALLLLLGAILATPAGPVLAGAGFAAVGVAQDDDDDGEGDDGIGGNGNGDDEQERDREKEEKRNGKDRRKQEQGNDHDDGAVAPAAGYGVEVTCAVAEDAARTECRFTSLVPAGAKAVSHLVIPEDLVCAAVSGGDFERVGPDPSTDVTGYRATGKEPYRLVLDGEVTTGGTATYWLKAADAVFPATGPGLACAAPATVELTLGDATTGTVTVSAYACTGMPADTSAYDWYGACDPGGDHRYVLELAGAGGTTTDLHAAETARSGEAAFPELAPGRYDLDDVDDTWCHAESDAVDAEGQVVVEAGAETTVWLFYCHDSARAGLEVALRFHHDILGLLGATTRPHR